MAIAGLPGLPLADPSCRDPHRLQHRTGLDYVIEGVVGLGVVATNGSKINTDSLGEPAPCWCAPRSKLLAPACGIKQF